ncbi:hypothetical protein U1Q18_005376 [Sarracenia purpurea var. burkii]
MDPNSTAIVTANQRRAVDIVRVQPKLLSSSLSSTPSSITVSIPNKKVNFARDCTYTQMLVQNHTNLKRSGPPARLLFYENGSWGDFASEVVGSITARGFVEGNAVFVVGISGARYLFDLHRMLQVDLESGSQRSIAWIDVHGKCFFPKIFVDGGGKFSNLDSNPKNEVLNISQYSRDNNLDVAENLPAEDPKSKIEIGIGGNLNSTKRKKECVEIESEESGKEKTERSSSDDQLCGAKRSRLTGDDVESPRWPKTKLLNEGKKAYSIVKNLFLSGIGIAEPGATITSVYQCTRSGSLDRARYEVFLKQVEITKAARGDAKMTFAWHGTSAEGVAGILSHGFAMPRKNSASESHGIGIYLSPVRSPHIR